MSDEFIFRQKGLSISGYSKHGMDINGLTVDTAYDLPITLVTTV